MKMTYQLQILIPYIVLFKVMKIDEIKTVFVCRGAA